MYLHALRTLSDLIQSEKKMIIIIQISTMTFISSDVRITHNRSEQLIGLFGHYLGKKIFFGTLELRSLS